ncbi:MAG: Nif3-like dinuclear metal center hexameric protein [Demequinaceae bacterium]|nr:Nif3-like dinuclear metal center hexameric protein [Demequinaceae bacterium]
MATVREIVDILDRRYPPHLAEDWDRVGLSVGDPKADVTRILFAVDPVMAVADEAISMGAQMVVSIHPLLLRGVHSVAADTTKGAVVHRLIGASVALYTAHTNADAVLGGVAEALAVAVGLQESTPLIPHPEEPTLGIGRVGRLPKALPLGDFAQAVSDAIPATVQGVRVAGDLALQIQKVAVLAGSGDKFFDAVRASGADVYVTADLRHHPASEAREHALLGDGRPALVDLSHFASEWVWLRTAAEELAAAAGVETIVSTIRTDPWTARFGGIDN